MWVVAVFRVLVYFTAILVWFRRFAVILVYFGLFSVILVFCVAGFGVLVDFVFAGFGYFGYFGFVWDVVCVCFGLILFLLLFVNCVDCFFVGLV